MINSLEINLPEHLHRANGETAIRLHQAGSPIFQQMRIVGAMNRDLGAAGQKQEDRTHLQQSGSDSHRGSHPFSAQSEELLARRPADGWYSVLPRIDQEKLGKPGEIENVG